MEPTKCFTDSNITTYATSTGQYEGAYFITGVDCTRSATDNNTMAGTSISNIDVYWQGLSVAASLNLACVVHTKEMVVDELGSVRVIS